MGRRESQKQTYFLKFALDFFKNFFKNKKEGGGGGGGEEKKTKKEEKKDSYTIGTYVCI